MEIFDKLKSLCRPGEEVLYLIYYGSQLYGTDDENSDLDIKGIFLPSINDLVLRKYRKSINWKSGTDNDKNSSDDVDIELWSVQYFIEILAKGDTNALDLLYSPSNEDVVLLKDTRLDPLFNNPLSLFDPRNTDAFIHYAIGQVKRFGYRGSRLGVLKRINNYLEENINFNDNEEIMEDRVKRIASDIIEKFYHPSYCFHKIVNGEDALVICGKTHLYSIRIKEFYNRITREYIRYGERARKAERNEGIDHKAISHAIRCIYQVKELLSCGYINFPLEDASTIYEVKSGNVDWKVCEEYIRKGLEEIEELQETTNVKGYYDEKFAENIILNMYF